MEFSFSIKLQKINVNVFKEYKTEREARQSNHASQARSLQAKRAARYENLPAKRSDFLNIIFINKFFSYILINFIRNHH